MKKTYWGFLLAGTLVCLALSFTPFTPSIVSAIGYFGFFLGSTLSVLLWYFEHNAKPMKKEDENLYYMYVPNNNVRY